jgi:hypothetical protein
MPAARVQDALEDVALGELRQVQAGAEVLALAGEHDGPHIGRDGAELRVQGRDQRIIGRIALGRPVQRQVQHVGVAGALDQGFGRHRVCLHRQSTYIM